MARALPDAAATARPTAASHAQSRPGWLNWLPVAPFFVYVAVFLIVPSIYLVVSAFTSSSGGATQDNVKQIFQGEYPQDYVTSLELGVYTAIIGAVCGFFIAYVALRDGSPRWIRTVLTTFSGVAANFAGVPLAFAFIATLGTTGFITVFLQQHGLDIYGSGFTLYSLGGLIIVYSYFQLPLMVLLIAPAIDGMKAEWSQAAQNLGASSWQYWRYVGLPILLPSLLSALVLLFGSAFAAYATAVALVGTEISLVPAAIGRLVTGDFGANPQMADALSLGMIVIIGAVMIVYGVLQRRAARWRR